MVARPIQVQVTPVPPAPFGLLETFNPKPLPDHGMLAGVEYDADYCGVAQPWTAPCIVPGDGVEKEATDGIEQVEGVPTVVYHLFSCRLIGISTAEAEARALRSLDLGSSRALEEGFGQTIGAAATDITPGGTAVAPAIGLALLEQDGGQKYGGQRVIHADNAVVTLLISKGLVEEKNGHLETLLGSVVVAGPGYGGLVVPSAPAAGAHWMYATGAVNVWEGSTQTTPVTMDSPYTNEFKALAERVYVPTYECFASAVEVTLEA